MKPPAAPTHPLAETASLLERVSPGDIERASMLLRATRSSGGTVFVLGNGGSATTASHFVIDLLKATASAPGGAIRAVCLAESAARLTAQGNDEGFDRVFSSQVEVLGRPGDVVVAISASGRSVNVLRAVERARELGLTVMALTGFDGGPLLSFADLSIHVPSRNGAYGPVEDAHLAVCHAIAAAIAG